VLRRRCDAVLLSQGERRLTGAAIEQDVERWAGALHDVGLRQGDRIAVQSAKSIDLVLLYLAVIRLGAIYLPLNEGYTEAEIGYFLSDAEPAIFVGDPGDLPRLADLPEARNIRFFGLDQEGRGSLREAVEAASGPAPQVAVAEDDVAAIVYTSGTTGRPKGAMITHRNLVSNARALMEAWEIAADDILLHALPLFHIHGLFVALNPLLLAGGRCELHPAFDATRVIEGLRQATLFMGVPTYYSRLLAEPAFTARSASGVRLFVSGSAPLSESIFAAFEARTGQRILERYGMSECGIICSNPLHGERVPGAVGKPLRDIEVRLAGDGPVGVLEVRGPNVCRGYWRKPGKTNADFREDGFFVTGDVASIDEEGIVRIVGRDKDMIISGGLNVYPKEIEALIDGFPEVDESAVIGIPHSDLGEAVAAVVKLNRGASLDAEEISFRLRPVLAGFKRPKAIVFVDMLPRNVMGKVQKSLLREACRDHFATADDKPAPR
jgi:malonyl-CoA/methylmalonyl-CoA synthetase